MFQQRLINGQGLIRAAVHQMLLGLLPADHGGGYWGGFKVLGHARYLICDLRYTIDARLDKACVMRDA